MATNTQPKAAEKKKSPRRRRGAAIPLDGAPRRVGIGIDDLKSAVRAGRLRAFPMDGRAFVEVEELERFAACAAADKRRASEAEGERSNVATVAAAGKGRGPIAALRQRLARVMRLRGSIAGMDLAGTAAGDHAVRSHGHEGIERLRRALRGERGVLTAKLESATRRRDFARGRLRRWGG